MHRAIIGDCVAWNPDMAPQAMEMKSIGKMGCVARVPSGYLFARPPAKGSGMEASPSSITHTRATAMNSSTAANRG